MNNLILVTIVVQKKVFVTTTEKELHCSCSSGKVSLYLLLPKCNLKCIFNDVLLDPLSLFLAICWLTHVNLVAPSGLITCVNFVGNVVIQRNRINFTVWITKVAPSRAIEYYFHLFLTQVHSQCGSHRIHKNQTFWGDMPLYSIRVTTIS